MKIIVTGATGFIGTALCGELRKVAEYSVLPVSRALHNNSGSLTQDYLDAPAGDLLIHLGEDSDRARVNSSSDDYYRKAQANFDYLLGLVYGHVIYCSSAVVYGDSGTEPYKEDAAVYEVDTYTKVKIDNEKKVLAIGGTVVRLGNVVGPGMAGNNVFSDIISQLSSNRVVVVRNGRPIRDFVWLDDVVRAFILLAKKKIPGVFNVGTGVGVSISDLARSFLKAVGRNQGEVKSASASLDYSYNVVDVERIRHAVGWEPSVAVYGSIEKLIEEL